MTDVRVGDVRKCKRFGIFVITKMTTHLSGLYNHHIIKQSGGVFDCADMEELEKADILAHYDTWQEAVNSKEFNE